LWFAFIGKEKIKTKKSNLINLFSFLLVDICAANAWNGQHIYRKLYKCILLNTIEGGIMKKNVTLKSLGIKRTVINKHGVGIWVYKYKNKFYGSKDYAINIALSDRKRKKWIENTLRW